MKKYKVYLFDFDGTLFDTSKALEYVFKEAYGSVGISIDESQVMYLSRIPLPVSYKELNAPKDEGSWNLFASVILKTINSEESVNLTRLYQETLEFFDYVKKNNISIGIVTSNNSKHVNDILNHFNLNIEQIKVVIGNKEAPTPKPDPMPLNVAIEKLGLVNSKEDVIYVGDANNDCLSAINAGIDYCFLDRENQGLYKDNSIKNLMELFK